MLELKRIGVVPGLNSTGTGHWALATGQCQIRAVLGLGSIRQFKDRGSTGV